MTEAGLHTSQKFSSREIECLSLSAKGMSDVQVGSLINISEATVRFHIRNACKKLHVRSRRAAIYHAAKLDII